MKELPHQNVKVATRFGQVHALTIGNEDARPLVFMHGFPGSHFQASLLAPFAEKFNLRLIAPDRPGYGFSDSVKNPNLFNFMLSLEDLLQHLKVDKFYVVGVSGGNPSAICMAAHFGLRVMSLGSICGLAPIKEVPDAFSPVFKMLMGIGRWTPSKTLLKGANLMMANFSPEVRYDAMARGLGPADLRALQEPDFKKMILTSMRQARRQGAQGILFDAKTYSKKWPYKVSDVKCPHYVYHGVQDKVLTHKMSEEVGRVSPRAKVKIFQEEGHYSLPLYRAEEILREIAY